MISTSLFISIGCLLLVGNYIYFLWSIHFHIKTHTYNVMFGLVGSNLSLIFYCGCSKPWSIVFQHFKINKENKPVSESCFICYLRNPMRFLYQCCFIFVGGFFCDFSLSINFEIGTHTYNFMFTLFRSILSINIFNSNWLIPQLTFLIRLNYFINSLRRSILTTISLVNNYKHLFLLYVEAYIFPFCF